MDYLILLKISKVKKTSLKIKIIFYLNKKRNF